MTKPRRTTLITTLSLALGAAIAVGTLAACGSGERTTGATGASTTLPTSGAAAYALACADCHGADGSGGQGPAIGRTLAGAKYDQASLALLITNGKGAMEGYAGDLPPQTIDQIAAYVRNELGQ